MESNEPTFTFDSIIGHTHYGNKNSAVEIIVKLPRKKNFAKHL